MKRFVDPQAEFLFVPADQVAIDVRITPESAGLSAIAHGFALVHGEADLEKLRLESPMYDALYAWCQSRVSVPN